MTRTIPLSRFAYYCTSAIILSSCRCDAFNSCIVALGRPSTLSSSSRFGIGREETERRRASPQSIIACAVAGDDDDDAAVVSVKDGNNRIKTITTTYETSLASDHQKRRTGDKKNRKFTRVLSWLRRTKPSSADDNTIDSVKQQQSTPTYRFTYDYNEMIIDPTTIANRADHRQTKTTGIMLIHPIGVGIGKWYYDRLFASLLKEKYSSNNTAVAGDDRRLVILAPDLLGSATACSPIDIATNTPITKQLPLLNITDWSTQILHLMSEYETKCEFEEREYAIDNWSIVANGGCSPIALLVAASSSSPILNQTTIPSLRAPVTHVILSSPPRLPFFLPDTTSATATDPNKVHKSYRTLSGLVGRLFWWYALRNNGSFIQQFSERNLVGNATNLGGDWTPNCIATARMHNGQSRYSTFAFLAGALQDGCFESLSILKRQSMTIDFIRGTDRRRNRARSWFWTRRKRQEKESEKKNDGDVEGGSGSEHLVGGVVYDLTIQQYVRDNGNRGKVAFVDNARISLAWENSDGYAKALLELCND